MLRYLRLYRYFFMHRVKILLEYRMNFFIGMGSTIILQTAGILTIWAVMRQIPDLQGWTFNELLLVYALVTLSKSINHMFADNLWVFGPSYVRTGLFDRFLIRPINPLFHLLADRFCHDGIGNFLIGLVLVVKAYTSLALSWSFLDIIFLALMVLSGGLIFIALNLVTAVGSFWMVNSLPLTQIVFQTHEFAKYPLTIYGRGITILLTWIIPYGFASYYPATYLLGRPEGQIAWFAPIVALICATAAYSFWKWGLRHYSSTGS